MKFIADDDKPDLVLMPIGGNFTMGPQEAAYAARELIRVSHIIPMPYGANPPAKGTPAQFLTFMKDSCKASYCLIVNAGTPLNSLLRPNL